MTAFSRKIAVVGGGITGLSAAFYVQRFFAGEGQQADITLVEKSERLGGKIRTEQREGFVMERGPDSFLARKLPIIELSRELGIEDELVPTSPKAKKTYILHHGRLYPMPPGLVLGIPTDLTSFMETGLVSPEGKTRVLEDLTMPKSDESGDEALGRFLERRLGREVVENISEPLLAGIYAADTYELSLQATFPQFQAAEQKYGSLIQGMQASLKQAQAPQGLPEAANHSVFLSYKRGLQTLVHALEASLKGAAFRYGESATAVERAETGYRVLLSNGDSLEADAVILAMPTFALAELLPGFPGVERLGGMPYISVANVLLAYDEKQIAVEFDGSGFLVPRKEGRFITACTWTSSKWEHTAPPGKVLMRCYVGRAGREDWLALSDEEIVQRVRREVRELMGVSAEPLFGEVTRLPRSMPQYPVGHLEHINEARKELSAQMPGVYIIGAGFHGVGLPDCIRQGKEAAEACCSFLTAAAAQ